MAPINPDLQNVQEDIKNVIQDLFQVMVQVSNYDAAGRPTRDVLAQDIQTLDSTLRTLHANAQSLPVPSADKPIPEPLIHYVENGRNPDIYTREFVELVRRMNQLARGKMHAFRDFRDVLAREMASALPEVRADIDRVLDATGGPTSSSTTTAAAAAAAAAAESESGANNTGAGAPGETVQGGGGGR
ncbi:transcription factor subunit Med10 of mediator complex-domain-containing protein [Thermothelomyces heterothallicus CBS 202.75]|uniref:transcription factor subunit Med10 of mediator complex-domain-containing protein n=1 Tax=Thermothelomyces heterothallicus CBS 202.75 TaxID=1149848 RepID=UPI003744024D